MFIHTFIHTTKKKKKTRGSSIVTKKNPSLFVYLFMHNSVGEIYISTVFFIFLFFS